MTGRPKISIVIPLYNHLGETREMLSSLLASLQGRDDYEIVMNDDGSTDGTREWLDTLDHPRIKTLKNDANSGFSRTCNVAVRESRGEVLVLANNDLVYAPAWLEPMLALLEDSALLAGVIGNVQRAVNGGYIDHAGVDVNYRGQLDHIKIVTQAEADAGSVQRYAVTAACCMLWREVFDAVGGLDERYVNGCEDMDLCLKVTRLGLRHYVALRSVIHHHVSLTRSRASLQNERNSELLYREWGPELEARLAQRWLDRFASDTLTEPSDGHDDLAIDPGHVDVPHDLAAPLARCLLQRNERHRLALLSVEQPAADYSAITVSGSLYASPLLGYAHTQGELHFALPPGVGVDGFFVCGHLYLSPEVQALQAEWWAVLEINGCQRRAVAIEAGDFSVGFNRPLMWQDAASSVRFRVEAREPRSGRQLDVPARLYEDVYLRHVAVDNTQELPLAAMTSLSAPARRATP
jgi:GT2 family glycosyltransferase